MEKKSNLQQSEVFGCRTINPKYCRTCIFAHGEPPFADSPKKAYCVIYNRDLALKKPDNVYFNGAPCEYYQNEDESEGEDYEDE